MCYILNSPSSCSDYRLNSFYNIALLFSFECPLYLYFSFLSFSIKLLHLDCLSLNCYPCNPHLILKRNKFPHSPNRHSMSFPYSYKVPLFLYLFPLCRGFRLRCSMLRSKMTIFGYFLRRKSDCRLYVFSSLHLMPSLFYSYPPYPSYGPIVILLYSPLSPISHNRLDSICKSILFVSDYGIYSMPYPLCFLLVLLRLMSEPFHFPPSYPYSKSSCIKLYLHRIRFRKSVSLIHFGFLVLQIRSY